MKISSRRTGQGPILILLHGYAGSVLHWKPIAESLESDFSVVLVNYGHFYLGRSALSFSAQVDLLANWIEEHFPGQRVNLAGISFGGALVWGLGTKYPQLVAEAIFVNPMPPNPMKYFAMKSMRLFFHIPLSRAAVFIFLSTRLGAKFLRRCAEIFRFQSEEEAERLTSVTGKKRIFIAHLFNNFAWILRSEKWQSWVQLLRGWSHQSLVIYDNQDPLFASSAYLSFAEMINCQNIVMIEKGGHVAILGQPKMIVDIMQSYLLKQQAKAEDLTAKKSQVA